MPDRTQTLLVEPMTREELETLTAELNGPTQSWTDETVYRSGVSKLCAALSQPEHQGDGGKRKTDWHVLAAMEREDREGAEERADDLETALVEKNDRIIELERRCVQLRLQPPAPVLSDEEREAIKEVIAVLEEDCGCDPEAFPPPGHRCTNCKRAKVLRSLASQEHRGEELPAKALKEDWRLRAMWPYLPSGYSGPDGPEPHELQQIRDAIQIGIEATNG